MIATLSYAGIFGSLKFEDHTYGPGDIDTAGKLALRRESTKIWSSAKETVNLRVGCFISIGLGDQDWETLHSSLEALNFQYIRGHYTESKLSVQ